MTQYLLSVHMVDGVEPPAPDEMQQMFADVDTFNQKLQAQGSRVFATLVGRVSRTAATHSAPDLAVWARPR